MPKFRVYMSNVVSHYIDVEADDPDSAVEEAETEGLPGVMLLDHTYPDEGGWQVSVDVNDVPQVEVLDVSV